jgi:polysaccharide export outer membrane protein
MVTFPIAGVIEAGGKTLSEVREDLRQRLVRGFVRDPQVTVNLVEAVDRVVTIEGEVERPGSYPVLGKMSLLRAVAQAGSPTEFARLKEVVIFREVEGRRYAALYDLNSVRRGIYADPEVYPNDVIVVDEARSRRLFKDLIALVPLVTTPLVLLLQ